MQIRQRLTYQFISIVALILFFSCLAIYFFSANYRRDDFYNRLSNKATNTAKLLLEVEEVDASLLQKIEKDNPLGLNNERIAIYDFRDQVLYSSDKDNSLKVDEDLLNKVRLEQEVRYKLGDLEILGFLFADKFDRVVVVVAAIDKYGLKKLKNLRTVLLIVFGISILLVFLSGRIYAGRALLPILKVIEQVDDITITSLNTRVNEGNGEDEIAKLAQTFNKMLNRLETAFKIQKNFIANASHELRTPLTAITGQLEVALIKKRTEGDYKTTIISVLDDIKSLNIISNRLLMLAQASSETSKIDFIPLRIDDIVWLARADLTKINENYLIKVNLDIELKDENQLIIIGNELLLKTAISNIMDNGCKYSSDHQVMVKITSLENYVKMQFLNQGLGIDPQDINNIFEPFHRGKNVSGVKGHGIGLSLADRIVKLHEGSIAVSSVINGETIFTISLPLTKF